MIRLRDITKVYHLGEIDLQVLKGITLDIKEGEFVSLTGASGSGKSTLMNILGCLDRPTSGHYYIAGEDVAKFNAAERATLRNKRIGFVFQNFNLLSRTTALENVMMPAVYAHPTLSMKAMRERSVELLNLVGLSDRMDHTPAQLSGGQQQRVAIARALATNPKILLCDEATSALDPTTTRSILALLKEINQTLGITIVVITHEMAVIEEICQRVAIIDSSRIAEVGTVDRVFTRPQSAMAKQLIYPDGRRERLATGRHYCRIVFDGNSSFEPVVSNMVLECKAPVNIMFADTKDIDGKAYGQMILQLPEDERAAKRALAYLETQNVHVEEGDAHAFT